MEKFLIEDTELVRPCSELALKTKAKFQIVDNWKRGEYNNELMFRKFYDPTVWAYAFLRNKQMRPLELYPWQDLVINDKHAYIQAVTSNQVGKSSLLAVKGIHHALHIDNATVLLVSRSEAQGIKVLDEVKSMMDRGNIPFTESMDAIHNRRELQIKNVDNKGHSSIIVTPPNKGALGVDATLVLLDEESFWEGEDAEEDASWLHHQVFETRTMATRFWKHPYFTMGQIVCASNPNGDQGIYWELFNDVRYHHYRFNWLANPNITFEEYEAEHKRMNDSGLGYIFASTKAAEFISSKGGFFKREELDDAVLPVIPMPPSGSILYIGGDFAAEDVIKGGDKSVLVAGYVSREDKDRPVLFQCLLEVFPVGTRHDMIFDYVANLKRVYTLGGFCYDKVGVGDSIKNELIRRGLFNESQILNLSYSVPNKTDVYNNVKMLFGQRRIKILRDEQMYHELLSMQFKILNNGISVHHRSESGRDDISDSIANLAWVTLGGDVNVSASAGIVQSSVITAFSQACKKCGKPLNGFDCSFCGWTDIKGKFSGKRRVYKPVMDIE